MRGPLPFWRKVVVAKKIVKAFPVAAMQPPTKIQKKTCPGFCRFCNVACGSTTVDRSRPQDAASSWPSASAASAPATAFLDELTAAADRLARLQEEELAMAEHRSERIKWLHFAMDAETQRLARLQEEEFAMDAEPSSSVVKVECKTEPSS